MKSIIFFIIVLSVSCNPSFDDRHNIPCTDINEPSNNVAFSRGVLFDIEDTERADLTDNDIDYCHLSLDTHREDKIPVVLNIQMEGKADVKVKVIIEAHDMYNTVFKSNGITKKRLRMGHLKNYQPISLIFEHINGKPICYEYSFKHEEKIDNY